MGASIVRLETSVVEAGTSIERGEQWRMELACQARTSKSVEGAADEDVEETEAIASLMRSNIGGRGVYTK